MKGESGRTQGESFLAYWWRGELPQPEGVFLAWAEAQRLLPLLAWRTQSEGGTLPQSLRGAAAQAHYRTAARQALAARQFEALSAAAAALDLPIIVVKGAPVAQIYPAPWMRPYTDIDLLVSEKGAIALLETLRSQGYRMISETLGDRGYHMPALKPPDSGLKLEIHTALARYRGRVWFTAAEWRAGIVPWVSYPGLYCPDPVDHLLYVVHHAVINHNLMMGLLPLADVKFLTAAWSPERWETLARKAADIDLLPMVGLILALTAWFWQDPWPSQISELFPTPPDEVLRTAQHMALGERVERVPQVWRDVPERNLRGGLAYLGLVLLGDPESRRELSWSEKVRFYVHRPFRLLKNYAPAFWKLLRGDRHVRNVWRAQRQLQEWLNE